MIKRPTRFKMILPICLVGLVGVYLTLQANGATDPNDRPNVIVFYTDDMRTDDLKFMPKTRKLFGQQGTVFDKYYSNNPLCCPFRATALTGQYTHNNNVLGNNPASHGGFKFFDDKQTIMPYLQQSGYKTAYIGKYLNGYDEKNATYVPPGYDEWFVPYSNIYGYQNTYINHNGTDSQIPDYVTDLYAQETNNTIREFSASGKPFVMYVSHLAPHGASGERPPVPAQKYAGTVKTSDLPKIAYESDVSDKPSWIRAMRPRTYKVNGRSVEQWRLKRAEALKSVDDAMASMVKTLTETGELKNTLIIFTSDNGFMSGEHRIPTGKIVPYEPSARVPMMARGPGIGAGVVRTDVTGAIDIAPTILDLADVTVPFVTDGRPLFLPDMNRKMLLEAGSSLAPAVEVTSGDPNKRSYVAVVDRNYKYILYWDGQREFYSLSKDPREQQSLINPATGNAYKSYAEKLTPYRQALWQLKNCAGTSCIVH